jgi:hypothetical protein
LSELLHRPQVGPGLLVREQRRAGLLQASSPMNTPVLRRKLGRSVLWLALAAAVLDARALPESLTMIGNRDLQCAFWAGFGIAMSTLDGLDLAVLQDDDVFRERMQGHVNVHLRRYTDALKAATPPGTLAAMQKDVDRDVQRKTATETLRLQAFLKSQRDRPESAKAYITSKLKAAQCRSE